MFMPPPSQDNCPAGRRAELMAETIMDNCNGDNNASLILRTWDPFPKLSPLSPFHHFSFTGGWRRAQKYAIKQEKIQPPHRTSTEMLPKKGKKSNNGCMCEWQRVQVHIVQQFADTAACKCNTNFAVLRPSHLSSRPATAIIVACKLVRCEICFWHCPFLPFCLAAY